MHKSMDRRVQLSKACALIARGISQSHSKDLQDLIRAFLLFTL